MQIFSKTRLAIFILLIGAILASFAQYDYLKSSSSQQEEGFITVDDGSLYYHVIGQGTPIVVLHGGPGLDQEYLKPQLLKLSTTHKVIFYDQRGSGKSLKTPLDEDHINLEQFVKDLEALRESLGLDKFILLGHSWGGSIGMQYAITHQEHLLGLILVCSSPADYKGQKAFVDEFAKRTKPIHEDVKALYSYEDFKQLNAAQLSDLYRKLFSVYFYDPEKVKELSLDFNETSAQGGFRVMEEMSKTSWLQPGINLFPQLKTVTIPTLILHGKQDIIPAWTAEEIKEAIPNSEIVIFDQCDHFPYIEQPHNFFDELDKFLNKLSP